jgi:thiol-disulfide isomerase/thioredoxin
MKTIFQNRWLICSLRLLLGVIFIFASIAKIQDIAKFVNIVVSYEFIPNNLAHLYGNIAPWVELFIGCALILGIFVRFSAALLIPLVLSFIVANSYALIKAVRVSCGCFGTFLSISHPLSLIIDVFMLFTAFILLFKKGKVFFSVAPLIDRLKYNSPLTNRIPIIKNNLPLITGVSCVIFSMGLVAVISIGIHNISKPPEKITETVNLPSPLSNEVDNALLQHEPVFLEFYIDDCPLCQAAAPVISDLEQEFTGQVVFVSLDYYSNPDAVSDLNVTATPTVVVITDKTSKAQYDVMYNFAGPVDQTSLKAILEQAIKSE